MDHEPSSPIVSGLVVRQHHHGTRVVVTLTGSLDLDGVEELAACADRICRSKARTVSFDVTGVPSADDAGVRTLAAACRCLGLHGVVAEVRGIGAQFRQALGRLGLSLPEPPVRVTRPAAARPAKAPAAPRPASAAIGR